MFLKTTEFLCLLFFFQLTLASQDSGPAQAETQAESFSEASKALYEEVEEPFSTVIYKIPDGISTENFQKWVQTFVEPDSWEDGGGAGSIWCASGKAVVRQTSFVHEKVTDFLDLLTHPDRKPKRYEAWVKVQNERVTLNYENVPIRQILDDFSARFGLKITVDAEALEDVAVDVDDEISFSVQDVPLWVAFEQFGNRLDFSLSFWECEDSMQLTAPENGYPPKLALCVYEVPETLAAPAGLTLETQDRIQCAIQDLIFPDTWIDNAGVGILAFVQNRLFCLQTQKVQRRIAYFFELAKNAGKTVSFLPQLEEGMELRVYSIAPGTNTELLYNAIQGGIEPETWLENGGEGALGTIGPLLFAAQTPQVHEKINRFLTQNENVFEVPLGLSSEELSEMLPSTVGPESWVWNGGEGDIFRLINRYDLHEKVLIHQTPENLVKFRALLETLQSEEPKPDENGMILIQYSNGDYGPNPEATLEAILTLVEPNSWKNRGGKGTFLLENKAISITQTSEIHQKIRQFLMCLSDSSVTFAPLPEDPEAVETRTYTLPEMDPALSSEDFLAAVRRFAGVGTWNEAEGRNLVLLASWSGARNLLVVRQKASVLREMAFMEYFDAPVLWGNGEERTQTRLLENLPDDQIVFRIFVTQIIYPTEPDGTETKLDRGGRGFFNVEEEVRKTEDSVSPEAETTSDDSEILTMTRGELNARIAEAIAQHEKALDDASRKEYKERFGEDPDETLKNLPQFEMDLERIARLQYLLEPESWRSETNPQGIGQIEKVGNFIFVRQRVRVMKQIENYFSWPTIEIMGMGGFM